MPKEMYTDGPPWLVHRIDQILLFGEGSPAKRWHRAACEAVSAGYWMPTAPPRDALDRLAELKRTNPKMAGDFSIVNSAMLDDERDALAYYRSMLHWSTLPSAREIREREAPLKAERAKQEALERRTREIAAEMEAEQHAQIMSEARRRAEKEISQ